jgi:hypothetical protein
MRGMARRTPVGVAPVEARGVFMVICQNVSRLIF